MNLGNIGKTIAGQALETTKNTVLDALRPVEPAKAPAPAVIDNTGAAILAQIQAMQRQLPEDQELGVYITAGGETLRALEIFVPNNLVLVFAGYDALGGVTRIIAPAETAQVLCKIVRVQPGARPARINILTPKPRPEVSAPRPAATQG